VLILVPDTGRFEGGTTLSGFSVPIRPVFSRSALFDVETVQAVRADFGIRVDERQAVAFAIDQRVFIVQALWLSLSGPTFAWQQSGGIMPKERTSRVTHKTRRVRFLYSSVGFL
jgi:hypothetical protein